jgi:hypothetical protein
LCSFVGKEVGFKLQEAPTAGDKDDREVDFLFSRVSLHVLECKLYGIYMNTNPVSQKKNTSDTGVGG